jgi:DNA-binding transcriptional ArsR family regulator
MDSPETIAALAALAQATRLDTFRLLVSREPDGVPAGELSRLMEVPQNTMSAHLAVPERWKHRASSRKTHLLLPSSRAISRLFSCPDTGCSVPHFATGT